MWISPEKMAYIGSNDTTLAQFDTTQLSLVIASQKVLPTFNFEARDAESSSFRFGE
jgi:hypothetical protein